MLFHRFTYHRIQLFKVKITLRSILYKKLNNKSAVFSPRILPQKFLASPLKKISLQISLTKPSEIVIKTISTTVNLSHPPNASSVLPFITIRENKLIIEDITAKMIPRTITLISVVISNISSLRLIPFCLYKRMALERRMRFVNIRTKQY